MKIAIILGFVGICLGQVVPEPKEPQPHYPKIIPQLLRKLVPGVKQLVPEPKQLVPEPKQLVPEPKQIVPEPKQARMCNSRFSFSNTGPQGLLESPNYPFAYANNYDMVICLASPAGTRITISCDNFNVESSTGCVYDKLYVSPSGDLEFRDEVKSCGNSFTPQTSVANSLVMGFKTDSSVVSSGYRCSINVVPVPTTTQRTTTAATNAVRSCTSTKSFTTVGESVEYTSPNFPQQYTNNFDEVRCFKSPSGTRITVTCDPFNLENQPDCLYDKLSVSLTGDLAFRDEMKYCGSNILPSLTSQANQLNMAFHTDISVTYTGFKCTVRVIGNSSPTQRPTQSPISTTTSSSASTTCECGARNVATRIVNGTQAKPAEFPWRCYLRTDDYDFFCGCSVISSNWIMTARHCTAAVEGVPISVVVGAHDRRTLSANQRTVRVDRIVNHPSYNPTTYDNDMALLHLSTSLTYNHDVSPICLPWDLITKNFSRTSVTASGWGTDQSGGNAQNVLMEVDLPVLTTEECQQHYGASITNNMICTYEPGKDTCQGDSGGSIDYLDGSKNRYYGIGVVSWGIGCAGRNAPGAYAKVTNYLNWIESSTPEERYCKV